MLEMKVSVVIPLYNKLHYVARAVQSVLAQTFDDFEVLVIDDGSTDGGGDAVRNFTDRRLSLLRQENKGVSSARNRGIDMARGELVAFLDADDEWKKGFLETVTALRVRFPEAGMYACAYECRRNNRVRLSTVEGVPPPPWEGVMPSYFRSAALGDPPVTASSVAIPRKVLREAGIFREGRRMGEDLDLWGRIALHRPVVFSWQVGAIYHQDTRNRACDRFTEADEHPFVETTLSMEEKGGVAPTVRCDLGLYISRLKLENARQQVLIGNYRRARHLCAQMAAGQFPLRKWMWGKRWNPITRWIWEAKTMLHEKVR